MAPTELYASSGRGRSLYVLNSLSAVARQRRINHELSALLNLLLHQFDSLFDYLVSETVDGEVYPVMFFAFHDEIVLETGSIWLVVAGLGYQIN